MTHNQTPAGWYPDLWGDGVRYWDGRGWTTDYRLPAVTKPEQPKYKWYIPPQRQVQRNPEDGVTVVRGPNHGLHFALTLFTCGMWLPVWILVALDNRQTVKTIYR